MTVKIWTKDNVIGKLYLDIFQATISCDGKFYKMCQKKHTIILIPTQEITKIVEERS